MIIQFAALGVVLVVGVLLVYVIFEMRVVYAEQRDKFLRAISAVEEAQRLQPEFLSSIRAVESDSRALQKVALQIEAAVAELNTGVRSGLGDAAERHVMAVTDLRDHLNAQDARLAKVLTRISEQLDRLQAVPERRAAPDSGQTDLPVTKGEYVRLRKEIAENDSELRFTLLKDWISVNVLAILRRASRDWRTPSELISGIPHYLQPEAEIFHHVVLLVGTRGHAQRLAIPIADLDPSSDVLHWFETRSNGENGLHAPAVLVRSNGSFDLVKKGAI